MSRDGPVNARSPAARYIPALSTRLLTPLYDPAVRWGMRERAFKLRLIAQAGVRPGMDVLDLGCGTGTLALMIKKSVPEARVTGLDGDPQVLAMARDKAQRAGADVRWQQAMAYEMPFPDRSFDVVVSSIMIHHLVTADKLRAFREIRRILRPGGAFHLVDFGPGFNGVSRLQAWLLRNLEEAGDNFAGHILPMIRESGFTSAQEAGHMGTLLGPIRFYQAVR